MHDQIYDYLIIGSGFGGSVAALRLRDKGYSVLVLESGRRFGSEDFPKTSWDLRKFIYAPNFGMRGIMRMDMFRGLMILSGAGVGGGSLVYANTLIEPSALSFKTASWPNDGGTSDWHSELAPYYGEVKRMLGVTKAPTGFVADGYMANAAKANGYAASFHAVDVAVNFGDPEVSVPDPYFKGEGPSRKGCNFCGGCMIGCRHNAKNTLDKNYLFLAERRGAKVLAEHEVELITPLPGGGYEVCSRAPGLRMERRVQRFRCKNVVIAAGVLGTLRLLYKCRDDSRTLPQISATLGTEVRTNSESLIGIRVTSREVDFSKGLAITVAVNPNPHTKIEAVRYPRGSDLMGLFSIPLLEGRTKLRRWLQFIKIMLLHPILLARFMTPANFAVQTIILLIMQSLDSKMQFVWRRSLLRLGRRALAAKSTDLDRPPLHVSEGNAFAKTLAREAGGEPGGSIADLFGMSFTAHVLGGCPMANAKDRGVINDRHEVHGYPGLYVVGGAAVPANLGVNPSLTIAAMAERAMSKIAVAANVAEAQ